MSDQRISHETHHLALVTAEKSVGRQSSKPKRQNTIKTTWAPTPLHMPKNHVPALESRVLLNEVLDVSRSRGSFGDDDNGAPLALSRRESQTLADFQKVIGHLGQQNRLRSAPNPGLQGDKPVSATHHLDYEDPLVAVGRIPHAVDRFDRRVYRRVKSYRIIGSADIVVNRSRDPHNGKIEFLLQLKRARQRAIPTDDHKPVTARPPQNLQRLPAAFSGHKFFTAGGPEDGPPAVDDAAHRHRSQFDMLRIDNPLVAVVKTDDGGPAAKRGPNDCSQSSVHTGGVAPAGDHSDTLHA